MLLRHSLGQEKAAQAVERAVATVLDSGLRTADLKQEGCRAVGCAEMGAAVRAQLTN